MKIERSKEGATIAIFFTSWEELRDAQEFLAEVQHGDILKYVGKSTNEKGLSFVRLSIGPHLEEKTEKVEGNSTIKTWRMVRGANLDLTPTDPESEEVVWRIRNSMYLGTHQLYFTLVYDGNGGPDGIALFYQSCRPSIIDDDKLDDLYNDRVLDCKIL
jgi:hypothetical protein